MVKQSVALDSLAMHKSDNNDSIIDTSTQQKGNLLPVALQQLKLSKELHWWNLHVYDNMLLLHYFFPSGCICNLFMLLLKSFSRTM